MGGLPYPSSQDETMDYGGWLDEPEANGMLQRLPFVPGQRGGLPPPSMLSPDTRKIIMDQINRLSKQSERKTSLWTDPAFLAGMTLLGGGDMGRAAMVASQAEARAEQSREFGDAKRATALSSLTGRLTEYDKAAAEAAKGKREAIGKALALVPPTQRGRLGKLIMDTQTDPADPIAITQLIEQNQIPMAPNLKQVPGVGLVDMTGDQPKVVLPVQHAPAAPVAEYEYAKRQGFKGTLMEYEAEKAKRGSGGPFAGTGMDAQTMNLLKSGDPMSPEYEMAYLHLYGPRQVQNFDGTYTIFNPPIPKGIVPPGTPRTAAPQSAPQAQAVPASPAPPASAAATTPLPGGGSVTRVGDPRLDRQAVKEIEERQLNTAEQLSRLDRIGSTFKPEYLQLGTRAGHALSNMKDFTGIRLTPEETQGLTDYTKFRREATTNLNQTIKDITGAAMGVQEAERIVATMPNAGTGVFDGDGPTAFKAKLDSAIEAAKHAMMRYSYAKANGLDPLKTGIELQDVPRLVSERGAKLFQEVEAANPGATSEAIKAAVRDRLAVEFGIRVGSK
ncbi:MAG: hypothetical protein FJX54_22195 [Alphaproteobacteria bacterium]|nr:hypothetical protein [Alphaproteobacteria bacterium]